MFNSVKESPKEEEESSKDGSEYEEEAPTTVITIAIPTKNESQPKLFKVLLDTRTSRNMGTQEAVQQIGGRIKRDKKERTWKLLSRMCIS